MDNPKLQILPPAECESPYSISQINQGISDRIESGNTVIWFTGEISNFKKQYGSGHCYLRLKDEESQISAVVWNSSAQKLGFEPEEGMAVTGVASIRVYKKGGTYQLDIHRMQPSGLGALYAAFEALKKNLEAEGLFAGERKKPLPASVTTLGVITSKSGAALRDIVRVVHSRAPRTTILLRSVAVQGQGAGVQIAEAIADFNAYGKADVLIVGRGGGSIEDLWAFNEEGVARAIAASAIPVVSAVGHETDFTIADFVADARAATPSAAAEMAVPDIREQERHFRVLAEHCIRGYAGYFRELHDRFDELTARPCLRQPFRIVADARQSFDEAVSQVYGRMAAYLRTVSGRFQASAAHLQAVSPLNILNRGYSVVSLSDGQVVRDTNQLKLFDRIDIRFRKGQATGEITGINE